MNEEAVVMIDEAPEGECATAPDGSPMVSIQHRASALAKAWDAAARCGMPLDEWIERHAELDLSECRRTMG